MSLAATASPSHEVYVTNEISGDLSVINGDTLQLEATMPPGTHPREIVMTHDACHGTRVSALTPDGKKKYVPGEHDGTITVLDAHNFTTLKTIQLDDKNARVMDAIVAPDGNSLYVSTGIARTVVHIDTRIDRVLRSVQVGARASGLAMSPNGRYIYVANGPSNDVSVIDADWFKVIATIAVGKGPCGVAIAKQDAAH